jgi:hypothetical protein
VFVHVSAVSTRPLGVLGAAIGRGARLSTGVGACDASAVSKMVGLGVVQPGNATRSRQNAVTMS